MMIFDGHADLLYDVTKWRQAGEDRVFERRHLPRLQAGQIGGLGLSIWTTVEQDSIWSAHPDWDGWRRTEEMMAWRLYGRRRRPGKRKRRESCSPF